MEGHRCLPGWRGVRRGHAVSGQTLTRRERGVSEEQELVRRCVQRDESACAELVERYQAVVFAVAGRMVHDSAVTEDLAQEVFLRVFRSLADFRGEARLSTWIYQIAYRVCLEELDRPRHRAVHVSLDGDGGAADRLPSDTAAQELADVDLQQSVDYWLSRLPPAYRMALTLYYLEDRKYTEIAAAMELPLGTVKTYLHRARRFLKDHILHGEPVE